MSSHVRLATIGVAAAVVNVGPTTAPESVSERSVASHTLRPSSCARYAPRPHLNPCGCCTFSGRHCGSAVTAFLLSPMKCSAARTACVGVAHLAVTPNLDRRAHENLREQQSPRRVRQPSSTQPSAVFSHRELGVVLPEQCQRLTKRLQSAASQHDACTSAGRE